MDNQMRTEATHSSTIHDRTKPGLRGAARPNHNDEHDRAQRKECRALRKDGERGDTN
jgi:hypothetical protein